jgi:hypothetical protein
MKTVKVGDKIVCIKSYNIKRNEIINNVIYTIYKFDYMDNIECVVINQNENNWFFSLEEYDRYFYFYEYFIPLKEIRKQKLEKINGRI